MAGAQKDRRSLSFLLLGVALLALGWVAVVRVSGATGATDQNFLAYSQEGPGLEYAGEPLVIVQPKTRAGELTLDQALELSIESLHGYWAQTLPSLFDQEYVPLQATIAYRPVQGEIPPCGEETPNPSEYTRQAFYCGRGDFVAWDAQNLFPRFYERFGDLSVGLVLAHEWGHAVQARVGYSGADPFPELQADCYAGAWFASIGDDSPLAEARTRIEPALIALFNHLGDPSGTGFDRNSIHGTPIQRQNSFKDGHDNGAAACLLYS
jgi:predicted metalloprotease